MRIGPRHERRWMSFKTNEVSCILLFLWCGFSLCSPTLAERERLPQMSDIQQRMLRASEAFERGDYTFAREAFSRLSRESPTVWQPSFNLGLVCSRMRDFHCSKEAFETAFELAVSNQDKAAILRSLAKDLLESDGPHVAVETAMDAVLLSPTYPSAIRTAVSVLLALDASSRGGQKEHLRRRQQQQQINTAVGDPRRDSGSDSSSTEWREVPIIDLVVRSLMMEVRLQMHNDKAYEAIAQLGSILVSNTSYADGFKVLQRAFRGFGRTSQHHLSPSFLANYIMAAGRSGRLAEQEQLQADPTIRDRLLSSVLEEGKRSSIIYPFHAFEVLSDPLFLKANANLFVAQRIAGLTPLPMNQQWGRMLALTRRVRVGVFSSASFSERTTTSRLLTSIFEEFGRSPHERIQLVCIFGQLFTTADIYQSAMTRACEISLHLFSDRGSFGPEHAAALVNAQLLHVCLDLSSLTLNPQPALWAKRPCRTQISFHGFPGTVSFSLYDYFLGDRVVSPPEYSSYFSEQLLLLPFRFSYMMGTASRDTGSGGVDPNGKADKFLTAFDSRLSFSSGHTVFCLFHQAYKLSVSMMRSLERALFTGGTRVVLWILLHSSDTREPIAELFSPAVRQQLIFSPLLHPAIEWEAKQRCNLHVDAIKFNGHTTSFEVLSHGTPVLTTPRETVAQRVTASILLAIESSLDSSRRTTDTKTTDVANAPRDDRCDLSRLVARSEKAYEEELLAAASIDNCLGEWRQLLRRSVIERSAAAFSAVESAKALSQSLLLTAETAELSNNRRRFAMVMTTPSKLDKRSTNSVI